MPRAAVRNASASARRVKSALGERAVPAHRDRGGVRLADLAVLHGNQLGNDADGDFLRRNGADVQAYWRVDPLE